MQTQQYQDNIDTLKQKIEEAEAIVVGGAAGMSEAIGQSSFYHADENFLKHFGKFADKYGIENMFMGYHYPYPTSEERWAFLATEMKLIHDAEAGRPYLDLMQLLQGKNYFIVTTNQDAQFSKTFPEEKVSPIQGDLRYFQCGSRCHDQVYFNKEQVENMYANIEGTRIPTELIPKCPKCGHEMEPWVRSYVFLEARNELRKYNEFLIKNKDKKVLFLELGVVRMTPMFIKESFWNMTYSFPNAYYITINPNDAVVPRELNEKGLAIKEDIARVLQDALNKEEKRVEDIG